MKQFQLQWFCEFERDDTVLAICLLCAIALVSSGCRVPLEEGTPESVISILKDHFLFEEAVQLIREEPPREIIRDRYDLDDRFEFIVSDIQTRVPRDNYLGGNLYVMGISFGYPYSTNDHLGVVTVVVNPIRGDSEALVLISESKASVDAPPKPSKLYLLGSYKYKDDPDIVIRIALRETHSEDFKSLYTVEYFISNNK